MQIHAIQIDHFLSFDTFAWEGLDPHLNVIVGPNGAGKTNLFHALRAVRDALSLERAQATARWAGAGHQGTDADTITISLDIQFTTEWEQRLLCAFLSDVFCNQQEIQQAVTSAAQRNLDSDGLRRFAAWVHERLRPEDISWLFTGRLLVTLAGRTGWQCQYEARPERQGFRLDLTFGGTLFGHAEHSQEVATQNWGSLFTAWRNSLTEQERMQLDNGLTGAKPEVGFPVPDLSHLPDWVSSQQGVTLQIGDQTQIVDPTTLATRRAFTSATQISLEPGRPFGMRSVFQLLLERALVFTDNVRLLPQRTFTAKDLFRQPVDLSSGEQLARFLFCKKNGNPHDRNEYRDIRDLFSRMTGRQFDVIPGPADSEGSPPRLSVSQQQGGSQPVRQPDISLELVTSGRLDDIPLEFSGAGIAEALFLSTVLAGSSGQVVLLDEPALNLHPMMQATLLYELQALAHRPGGEGGQFLMNTHSPSLIPPSAITNITRLSMRNGNTCCAAINRTKMDPHEITRIEQELRKSIGTRSLLFSRGVILVEGGTELGAFPIWFEKHFKDSLERQDIAIHEVGSDQNFKPMLKFLQSFDIPWTIVCDGKVIGLHLKNMVKNSNNDSIVKQLEDASVPNVSGVNDSDFSQLCQELEPFGVFTLAKDPRQEFEALPIIQIHLAEARHHFPKSKVRQAQYISTTYDCPDEVAHLMQKVIGHLVR